MLEHAEQVWQRQLDNEEAGAGRTTRAGLIFRCVLLALAIAAIVFVLFQRLAQLD